MTSTKCCFCLPMKVGVIALGVAGLIIFSILFLTSIVFLLLEKQGEIVIASTKFKIIFINALLVPIQVISVLGTLFSILLIIGIYKHYPGLVLTYFGFVVLTTVLMMVGTLLCLIHNYLYMSVTFLIITALNFYCLNLVYKMYDLIQKEANHNLNDEMDDALIVD